MNRARQLTLRFDADPVPDGATASGRAPSGDRVARAFGDAVARLHRRTGGDPRLAAVVARWAQQALRQADAGHVCVEVADRGAREQLATSPAVDPPAELRDAPLVLDGDALYLRRLWQAEERLASAVVALGAPAPLAATAAVSAVVDSLFAPT